MTNEEIIDTTRGTELWQYYGEEINKLLDLARQDEREKLSTEIYKLQREIIPMTGIRGSYIHTKDLHTILPEKGVEF